MPLAEQLLLALALIVLGRVARLCLLDYQFTRHYKRSRKMAKFDAAKVIEGLDYDFRPHYDKHGTIREPHDQQIADFMASAKKLAGSVREKLPPDVQEKLDTGDVSEMFSVVEDLDPQIVVDFHREMAGVYAALCSGDPSRDELLAVPIRVRVMFYGWLQQEVMSPEAVPGGGSNVTTLPARAG